MNESFRQLVEALDPLYQRLISMKPFKITALSKTMPTAGVYLFSEGDQHLYAGRTNALRRRLPEHCRPSSTHNQAPFAFRLARETTGQLQATYRPEGSRAALALDKIFDKVFKEQKIRIRKMDVRIVSEPDPLRQGLLEVYVAVAVAAPYNDFDTH